MRHWLGLVLVGLLAAACGDSTPRTVVRTVTVTATPSPAPTVTITETREVVPQACLDALDESAKFAEDVYDFLQIVQQYPLLVLLAAESGVSNDTEQMGHVADEMERLSNELTVVVDNTDTTRFISASDECREAAKESGQ